MTSLYNLTTSMLIFNDRETYLAWVADWKASYKALAEEIRETKRQRSAEKDVWKHADLQAKRHNLRVTARRMMALRMESKERAREQYAARKAAEAVAA